MKNVQLVCIVSNLFWYWDVFNNYNERIQTVKTNIKYHIETGYTLPIKSKCRPLNLIIGLKVKERIDDLENIKVIRNSSWPWVSPMPVVAERKNSFKPVADCRRINNLLTNAWVFLKAKRLSLDNPKIQTSMAHLANQKPYSIIELKVILWSWAT